MTDQPSTPLTRRTIAGLAAGILLLAACSAGGAAAPTSPGAGNGSPAGGGPASPVGNAGGGGGAVTGCGNPAGATVGAAGGTYASMLAGVLCGMPNIDPCSYLKPADVQALFKATLGQPTTDHLGSCTWPLADPSQGDGLDVVVHVGEGTSSLDQDMGISGDLKPISGVGDKASWDLIGGYFPHFGAVKGNATCELTAGGGNAALNVATTGVGPLAAIDPAAVAPFMAKFGALCNQIFAGLGA